MRRALLLAALWLTSTAGSCATTSAGPAVCLPLKPYTAAQQAQIAADLAALPPAATALPGLVEDYEAMRDADRACMNPSHPSGG